MKKKRNTFVGTAEYVSPEVLQDENIGPECDLWALGCILYRFLVGKTPFKDKTEYLIFENIRKNKISFPDVLIYIILLEFSK
jgi:3-phosphoinositide dependent protein kinase-1